MKMASNIDLTSEITTKALAEGGVRGIAVAGFFSLLFPLLLLELIYKLGL